MKVWKKNQEMKGGGTGSRWEEEGVERAFGAMRNAATVFGFVAPKDLAGFVQDLVGPDARRLAPLSPDDLYQVCLCFSLIILCSLSLSDLIPLTVRRC